MEKNRKSKKSKKSNSLNIFDFLIKFGASFRDIGREYSGGEGFGRGVLTISFTS